MPNTRKLKSIQKDKLRQQAYELHLQVFTQLEISQMLKKSQGYVSELINQTLHTEDFALGKLSIEQFLSEFHKFKDYCTMLKRKLSLMKGEDQSTEIKIMELQMKIAEKVLIVGAQGQFMQAVQAIRDGKLQMGEVINQLEDKK